MNVADPEKANAPGLGTEGVASEARNRQETGLAESITANSDAAKGNTLVAHRGAIRNALMYFQGHGPYRLHSVGEGTPFASSGPLPDVNAATDWAVARNGERANVYFVPAQVSPRLGTTKAKDVDVVSVGWIWADVDRDKKGPPLPEQRPSLLAKLEGDRPACLPEPTAIIDSGGGYWGFWRLATPLPPDEARKVLCGVADVLGSDRTFDPSRIARLPGTVNWPDEGKRKAGQVPALARLIRSGDGVVDAAALPVADPVKKGEARPGGTSPKAKVTPAQDVDLETLPLTDKMRQVVVRGNDPDEPARYPSRSEALFAVLCAMIREECDDATMLGVILDPAYGISAHVLEQPRPEAYARDQIAKARAKVGYVRRKVVYDANRLHETLEAAETALIASGLPIYQQGDRIVTPVRLDVSEAADGVTRDAGSLVLREVTASRLVPQLTKAANFVRRGKDDKEHPCAVPVEFARAYLGQAGNWKVPVLRGLAGAPTLRPDGSLLNAEGYDPATGLILDFGGVRFLPVPDRPSQDEAKAALEVLKEPLETFPFVDEAARSVALSAILTALIRRSLRTAPLHGISAPSFGTGKSLLADVVAMIATGADRAPSTTQGKNEEEDEKRWLSVLLRGDPLVSVDNILRPVEGDALATILTSETWQCRILGRSELATVSTRVLILANGNNLAFRDDMATRVVVCRLDAGVEAPEKRTFDRDLRTYVPANRARLVQAALTILRGYAAAGYPKAADLTPFGRFEEWSKAVRGALVWVGVADPCDTREAVAAGDEGREELAALMEAWERSTLPTNGATAAELIDRAGDWHHAEADGKDAALRAALEGCCPRLNPKSLGKYLAGVNGRIVGGRRIVRQDAGKHAATYKLEVAGGS